MRSRLAYNQLASGAVDMEKRIASVAGEIDNDDHAQVLNNAVGSVSLA